MPNVNFEPWVGEFADWANKQGFPAVFDEDGNIHIFAQDGESVNDPYSNWLLFISWNATKNPAIQAVLDSGWRPLQDPSNDDWTRGPDDSWWTWVEFYGLSRLPKFRPWLGGNNGLVAPAEYPSVYAGAQAHYLDYPSFLPQYGNVRNLFISTHPGLAQVTPDQIWIADDGSVQIKTPQPSIGQWIAGGVTYEPDWGLVAPLANMGASGKPGGLDSSLLAVIGVASAFASIAVFSGATFTSPFSIDASAGGASAGSFDAIESISPVAAGTSAGDVTVAQAVASPEVASSFDAIESISPVAAGTSAGDVTVAQAVASPEVASSFDAIESISPVAAGTSAGDVTVASDLPVIVSSSGAFSTIVGAAETAAKLATPALTLAKSLEKFLSPAKVPVIRPAGGSLLTAGTGGSDKLLTLVALGFALAVVMKEKK